MPPTESRQFRTLDPEKLVSTAEKIAVAIGDEFPDSGLAQVGDEVADLTRTTIEHAHEIARPLWGIRCTGFLLTAFILTWPLVVSQFLDFHQTYETLGDFIEATDAGLHLLIAIAGAIIFFVTWEDRVKRNRALRALSELRSVSHIIDMHQISKDPGVDHRPVPNPEDDTRTVRSDHQLALYLDFSSDLLAIVGKLAAYYAHSVRDRTVLDAVNEIETLTNGLSAKLWQKVAILSDIAESVRRGEQAGAVPGAAGPDTAQTRSTIEPESASKRRL